MKKLLALLMALLMLLGLTACEEEEVDLALDIAIAVMEELEKRQAKLEEQEKKINKKIYGGYGYDRKS